MLRDMVQTQNQPKMSIYKDLTQKRAYIKN